MTGQPHVLNFGQPILLPPRVITEHCALKLPTRVLTVSTLKIEFVCLVRFDILERVPTASIQSYTACPM